MEEGFDDFIKKLNNAGTLLKENMENALMVSGEIVRGNIVKGIRGQKYNFVPLAPATLKAKSKPRKRGKYTIRAGSRLTLVDQSDYVASFAVEKKDWDEVQVGTNHPQGRALELGYAPRNLPARPHVAPAFEESIDVVQKTLQDALSGVFK
ncbi:MAG: phage morphogenesis protein [Leptospirales bacterium]|nr:phage morphogenesis protein [Leptospirales bacterium]